MPDDTSARRANTTAYAKLIELASLRLRFAAAAASSRESAIQALDAEADRIVEALRPYGAELQVGTALVAGGADWDQVVNDLNQFADDIQHAADAIADAYHHANEAVGQEVVRAAEWMVDAVGGDELLPREAVEVVGLIEEVAVGRSAAELVAVKENLIEAYSARLTRFEGI